MKTLHIVLVAALLAAHVSTLSASTGGKELLREDVAAIVKESDRLFEKRNYSSSLKLLEDAEQRYPEEAEILWRLSNQMINEGDASKSDEQKREQYYRRSMAYAGRAVKADNGSANAHALLAASYGSYAMFAGGKEKVKLANQIRDELDIALKLDPDNEYAHTIYGTWHREVSEVSWIERRLADVFLGSLPEASLKESIDHLKHAISVSPKILRHSYELGPTYIAAGQDSLAASSFKRALACPNTLKTDPQRRTEMQEWLADNR